MGLDYGNNDGIQYTYDRKGRLICQIYEDGDTVTYQYDNDGSLAAVTDSATGITTHYFYDFVGRIVKYTQTGTDYNHSVTYTYDEKNNLSVQTEIINGTAHTTTYTYDDDNRVTAKTTDNITVAYTYDNLDRLTQQVTKNGETTVKTESYTYKQNGTQVHTYSVQATDFSTSYTYYYDDNGNISREVTGGGETEYWYDSANQLIREYNDLAQRVWIWSYDNGGNITARTTHNYVQGNLREQLSSDTYTYGDDAWGDLLTGYNSDAITYDAIGNPLTAGARTYTWEHGRQLSSLTENGATWSYSYDSDGMRTSRTNGTRTYKYIYNGSQLVQLKVDNNTLLFTYDAQNTPETITFNGTVYYYITNLQGDVIAIVDGSGNVKVAYTYNAYGQRIQMQSNNADSLALYNPLCYRGYVYDAETELYYLQSRYYDPQMGRFLNADDYPMTGQGLSGNNMFAYCGNNPINRCDTTGKFWLTALVSAAVNVATTFIAAKVTGQSYTWTDASVAFISGAANVIPGVGPLLSGSISGGY